MSAMKTVFKQTISCQKIEQNLQDRAKIKMPSQIHPPHFKINLSLQTCYALLILILLGEIISLT
jgi:hypothetical protein